MKKLFLSAFVLFAMSVTAKAAVGNDVVKLNQVGYYPQQEKMVVVEGNVSSITVTDADGRLVTKAKSIANTVSNISKKKRSTFDLSNIKTPGVYTITAGKAKVKMIVSENALDELGKAAIKSFYYQRTAMPIEARYAGKWARPAGHMDTNVEVHPAAASAWRPAGTMISSSKGWYDAGDYNKYVVNSAFSMGLMLAMYEMVPEYFDKQKVDIPENGNSTADLLDENMWNLDWLYTMQDYDGGVYHKLTTPSFESFIMPGECKQQRYVTQKSTCATLDFAAIMAKCSRVYSKNKDYSDTSIKAINAARTAYEWAKKNPSVFYRQEQLNEQYSPKVSTGTYGDESANDEFFWAATELYLATGEKKYLDDAVKYAPDTFSTPSWGGVAALGTYALATAVSLPQEAKSLQEKQKNTLLAYAKNVMDFNVKKTSFYCAYGNQAKDFFWGCNSEGCGVQGVSLLFAYKLSGDKNCLVNALRNADYMLGRNATGYCYVTGFGEKSPMNPHHRLSAADGIEEPVPGLLVGGPNPGQQDKEYCSYPSNFADESYSDSQPSYASNEIAINWSATLVALINGLNAMVK